MNGTGSDCDIHRSGLGFEGRDGAAISGTAIYIYRYDLSFEGLTGVKSTEFSNRTGSEQ